MIYYVPEWYHDGRRSFAPKFYQFTRVTRRTIEDFGEPIFATNGWEYVLDYDTDSRIYGPPGVIQLWNWWRHHKWDFIKLILKFKLVELQKGGYYRDARVRQRFL